MRKAVSEIQVPFGLELIICDGSPGIGCPVIASLTGASLALFVVEPTVSGIHDFHRVAQLTARLDVPGLLAVNKSDLNEEVTQEIEQAALKYGILPIGRIPYDREVTRALVACKSVVEVSDGPAANTLWEIWTQVQKQLTSTVASNSGGLVQIKT